MPRLPVHPKSGAVCSDIERSRLGIFPSERSSKTWNHFGVGSHNFHRKPIKKLFSFDETPQRNAPIVRQPAIGK